MPYANISELSACLNDCIAYCREHPEHDFCARMQPNLVELREELDEAWDVTDARFSLWRREAGEDKLSWKKLARTLRDVQKRLEKIDAIGFPNERVMYWDAPLLEVAVEDMVEYLSEHADDIEFAQDYIEKMERLRDSAHDEHDESREALRSYRRHFRARRDTLAHSAHLIGEFRDAMRNELGEDHDDYQSIRWAWSVSPDHAIF
ncbi:MAG: hypothetical protein ACOCV2_08150 [Persicimonas sp.]